MRRIGAPVLLAVGLMLGASACEEADQIAGQVQASVEQGVDAASEALSDAGDAISGATRSTFEQVRSGVDVERVQLAARPDVADRLEPSASVRTLAEPTQTGASASRFKQQV